MQRAGKSGEDDEEARLQRAAVIARAVAVLTKANNSDKSNPKP